MEIGSKDQKKIKGTTKPLMANLDITRCFKGGCSFALPWHNILVAIVCLYQFSLQIGCFSGSGCYTSEYLLHRFDPCVNGGESILLDAYPVLEELRQKHPEHFATLARVPATFQKIHYERYILLVLRRHAHSTRRELV